MSKLRPGMGPSRKERKAQQPPPRLTQEEEDLFALFQATLEVYPANSYERLQVEIALASHKRMGELIRHLQEIEGRAYRGRF